MKIFEGIVKKISGPTTAVLEIERLVAHPIYKKIMRKSTSIKFDTTGSVMEVGQKVRIVETRPISKDKNFKIYTQLKKEKASKKEALKK